MTMELKIRFNSSGSKYPVNLNYKHLGLLWVDQAREAAHVSELSLDRITDTIGSECHTRTITIDESMARAAGHWSYDYQVEINVPPDYLNQYFFVSPVISKNEQSGEITRVTPVWELDKRRLLSDWQEAGYPLYWDCEPPNDDER
jgi:hypothetical protein